MNKAATPAPERKPLGLRRTLVWLYEGVGKWPVTFRWVVLIFDVLTISYFLVSPFIPKEGYHFWLDYVIGAVIALDLVARFYIAAHQTALPAALHEHCRHHRCLHDVRAADLAELCLPADHPCLRIARAFTFLRDNSPLSSYLHLHRVVIERAINVVVFLFIMSALVYADQVNREGSDVHNYLDAFYFTVTSLTTTGYGDVTLVGWTGRVLPIIIMLLGVTLFLRLLRALVTPTDKARSSAPIAA